MTTETETTATSAQSEFRFENVSPASIVVPQLLLRQAQVEDEGYMVLKNSLTQTGQRNPILVAPGTEPGTYILSDGMQRLSIAKELGWLTVFVRIENLDESQIAEAQMEMNLAKVNTKLSDYSKLLLKYAQRFPTKTKAELARRVGVSTGFLDDRLNFSKLCPEVQRLTDESTIGLSKAVLLAGLDPEVQKEFIERAATLQIDQFAKAVSARKTELNKAKNEGRPPKVEEYIATAALRPKVEIIAEQETYANGLKVCGGLETAIDGYSAAINWVLKMDAGSIAEGQARWDLAKKTSEEKKDRLKQERARKQQEQEAAVGEAVRG